MKNNGTVEVPGIFPQRGGALKALIADFLKREGYRLVNEEDIRPGARISVMTYTVLERNLALCLSQRVEIVLDEHCLANGMVFYHAGKISCHVPKAIFIGGPDGMVAPLVIVYVLPV